MADNLTVSDSGEDSYDWLFTGLSNTSKYFVRPLICFVGITGNSMAMLLIRSNRKLWKLPSNIYLFWLALSSAIFLSVLLLSWLDGIFRWNYYHETIFACKLFTYVTSVAEFLCTWLIVAVCCDRLIVFYWPVARFKWCTRAVAFKISVAIFLVAAIFYSWVLVFSNIIPMKHEQRNFQCDVADTYSDAYLVMTWVDTLVCIVLPVTIIIITNTMVLIRFKKHRKFQEMAPKVRFRSSYCTSQQTFLHERENVNGANNTSLAQNAINGHIDKSLDGANGRKFTSPKKCIFDQQGHGKKHHHTVTAMTPLTVNQNGSHTAAPAAVFDVSNNKTTSSSDDYSNTNRMPNSSVHWRPLKASDLQLTSALLCVTAAFLILLAPNYIFRCVTWFLVEYFGPSWEQSRAEKVLEKCIYMIYYSHHALLFYLYIFWSPQMKKQLWPTALKLLECYCCKTVPDLGYEAGNKKGSS